MSFKIISLFVFVFLFQYIISPPVTPAKPAEAVKSEDPKDDPLARLEYQQYLKEVVNVLEADPEFKKMVEAASVDDIKSGKISQHLGLVSHNVRTQLDELKRKEIDRLSKLIARKIKLNQLNGQEIQNMLPQHVDHENADTFESGDLEKLIRQASTDLEVVDKQRKEEFKEHELEKEYNRRKKLEKLSEGARRDAEKQFEAEQEKRKHHEKVNHPGSKDQLEEVWEKQDELEPEDFDPRTFFSLHDTNSDNLLGEYEIEALFQLELNKIYNSTDYDPKEREEDMNRMREHFMNEIDKNKDRVITLEEFLNATQTAEFEKKEDWKTVEDEPQFEKNEFDNFSRTHEEVESTLITASTVALSTHHN